MPSPTRTWPFSPRRIVAVATDWAGDRLARWVDRTLAWIDPVDATRTRPAIPHVVQAPARSPDPIDVTPTDATPPTEATPPTDATPTDATPPTLLAEPPPLPDLRARAPGLHESIAALEAALASPLDFTDVHRVRVATRRLRTFLGDLKRAEIEVPRGLARAVRRCARAFGDLRECDAQLDRLRGETFSDADAAVVAAHERRLVKRRAHLVAALRRERDRIGGPTLVRDLRACVESLASIDPTPPVWIDHVLERRRADWHASIPADVAGDQLEVLHRIRVRAKQMRYSVRWLGELAPPSMRRLSKLAKRVQRRLGEHREAALLHDALVRRHARAHAQGRTAEIDGLAFAMAATRRACDLAFAPVPALLAEARKLTTSPD